MDYKRLKIQLLCLIMANPKATVSDLAVVINQLKDNK